MKKSLKLVVILFLMMIFVGAAVSVYKNYKEDKKKEEGLEVINVDNYKVKRSGNQYTLIDKENRLKDKEITNIFYDNKNIYLYLKDENEASILKYNVDKNKVSVIMENNKDIKGDITKIGKNYKINNTLYDNNFKKVEQYPTVSDSELLYPDLKSKLVKKDDGVYKVDLTTNEEVKLVDNKEESYIPYLISNDGKTIIVKNIKDNINELYYVKDTDELEKIVVKGYELKDDETVSSSYELLDKEYLLEIITNSDDVKTYNVYNVTTKQKIYTSDKKCNNYVFLGTVVVYNDSEGNIVYKNYVTEESKILLNKEDKSLVPDKFRLSTDNYSIVLTVNQKERMFYIFYL